MQRDMSRRGFLGALGAVAAGSAAPTSPLAEASESKPPAGGVKIVGISCSPRRGKTTATALGICLRAAGLVDRRIETELIDLGGLTIHGSTGTKLPPPGTEPDDFDALASKLKDPAVRAIVIGSPVYFRTMSALCKSFIERCAALRVGGFALANKAVGALAVGGYRNGGQELVIEQIQAALLCHEVFLVGGKPRAHQGATVWNIDNADEVLKDRVGMDSAQKLGRRLAEAALLLAGATGQAGPVKRGAT